MSGITKIPLVSSEISSIWNSYIGNSLTACVLKVFVNKVDDQQTRSILQHALDLSNQHIQELTSFFNQSALPVPEGFNDTDIDINAPRLYTDEFYLMYLSHMSRSQMLRYSLSLSTSARADIREFFSKLVNESVDLYNKVTEIRLSKGIFTRTPQVEVPKKVEYIESSSFMSDFFGEKRTLLTGEITHIASIILSNIIGRALITGFGQVSKSKEIAQYMFKGRDISSKKIDVFTSVLTNENIPIPSTSYSYVTDSTISPFSEKLMVFHITALNTVTMVQDGIALADSLRVDLHSKYVLILTEIMKYAKDGSDIMISNKWAEQPPQCIEHKNLVTV